MVGPFFIGIASLIHVYIFAMESVLWGKPRINKTFRVSPEQAEQTRLFAFNQGFYNLFLAVAGMAGILFSTGTHFEAGMALMAYAALSMVGAAVVLFCSERKLARAALIQGLPPLLGLILCANGL
jgi:putative membrane protein